MYYPDLSQYEYSKAKLKKKIIIKHSLGDDYSFYNIGWLSVDYVYTRGKTNNNFHEKLFSLCIYGTNLMMGIHYCDFCNKKGTVFEDLRKPQVEFNNELINLGGSEVFVIKDKTVFIAPSMVLHYVLDHEYLPPDEFIDALMQYEIIPDNQDVSGIYVASLI
jgi:hypothetical protein